MTDAERSDHGAPNGMAERIGRLLLFAAVVSGAIFTQRVVSATAIVVERMERSDTLLADLTATINSMSVSVARLVSLSRAELDAVVSDFDQGFDRALARVAAQRDIAPATPRDEGPIDDQGAPRSLGEIDVKAIDIERRAFVRAVATAGTPQANPYQAGGQRSVELHARKLAGAILGQRERIDVAKSRALFNADLMVTLSSTAAMLMMACLIWRPVVAARAHKRSRWFTPLFSHRSSLRTR